MVMVFFGGGVIWADWLACDIPSCCIFVDGMIDFAISADKRGATLTWP